MSELGKNCFIVDWFSASCFMPADSEWFDLLPILGLTDSTPDSFADGWGHHGYVKSASNCGIRIYYDYKEDDSICNKRYWVEMSGKGCRTFETISKKSFTDLFKLCVSDDPNAAPFFVKLNRVDLAFDIFDNPFLFDRVKAARSSRSIISPFSVSTITEGEKLTPGGAQTYNERCIYFGSIKSDIFMRLYDKKLEQLRNDVNSWYRWETVFKNDNALEFVKTYLRDYYQKSCPLGRLFKTYLDKYVSVRVYDANDSNYRRWAVASWWESFTRGSTSIEKLTPKQVDYNMRHVVDLVQRMYGNTIDVIIKTKGEKALIDLIRSRATKLSDIQIALINEWKSGDERFGY